MALLHLGGCAGDFIRGQQIGDQELNRQARNRGRQLPGAALSCGLITIDDEDVRARLLEARGNRPADPVRAAADQRDAAFEWRGVLICLHAGSEYTLSPVELGINTDWSYRGLPAVVLAKALLQAKEARLTILGVMAGAIAEPRDHVANSAPKIVSMEIPIDKIGEVIGPKGKVINTLQQETGADIAVDDDGMVGTVTIGAKDGNAVEEARRRISLILDPPTADVGAVYAGKEVNITKFGAFVNVLPGRDGLLHISKLSSLAGGKRINNVEDVLTLGQPVEVRVDDIDPQGKVSLSLASAPESSTDEAFTGDSGGGGSERGGRDRDRGGRDRDRGERTRDSGPSSPPAPAVNGTPSFEDAFEAELVSELGDLGPGAVEAEGRSSSGGDRRPPRGRSRRR